MSYKETERRVEGRWKKEITTPKLKGKLNFQESFQMLVNRCMTCPPEEYPENVHRLYWSLPKTWRDEDLYDVVKECQEQYEYSQPVIVCGVPIKTDILPDTKWTETEMDWHMLFNEILNCANRRNLLIPTERVEVITEPE